MPQTAKKLESHVSSQYRVLWAHAISGSCEIDHPGSCGRYLRFESQCATLRQRRGRSPLSPNGVGSATRFRPRSIFGTQRSESAFRRTLSLSSSMGIAARMGSKVDGTGGANVHQPSAPSSSPCQAPLGASCESSKGSCTGHWPSPTHRCAEKNGSSALENPAVCNGNVLVEEGASRRSSDCV